MGHPPNIPLHPQTDERNFPRWAANAPPGQSGHPYPKMLCKACTKEDRSEWLQKNRRLDQNTRQEYWEGRPPLVGSPIPIEATQELVDAGFANTVGEPVVVRDEEDEETVMEMLGLERERPVSPPVGIPLSSKTAKSRDDLEEENARLRRELAAKPKVKRAKRKKRKAAARHAAIEDTVDDAEE